MADKRSDAGTGNEILPNEISHVLEGLPEEKKTLIEQTMVAQFAMITNRTSPELEVTKKITSEHITKILENESIGMEYSFKDVRGKRTFYLIVILIVSALLTALSIILKDNPEVLEKVLIGLGGAIAGAFGGYGVKAHQDREK